MFLCSLMGFFFLVVHGGFMDLVVGLPEVLMVDL